MAVQIGLYNQSNNLRDIKYTSRDFASLRNDFLAYFQKYFPDAGIDTSLGSGAQLIMELQAYATDILNFYLDKQFNELFLIRSTEINNVFDIANALSYTPKSISPSVGQLNLTFDLPITGSLTSQFYFNIQKATRFIVGSQPDIVFENVEPIIFNSETQNKFSSSIVTRTDNIQVTRFSLTGINVISGITKLFEKNMDNSDNFKRIHIEDRNGITDIMQVFDSDGNEWFKVKNLAQEFVFTGIPNVNSDNTDIPFLLTVKRVPRRFVAYNNPNGTADLAFGFGDIDLTDTEFILSPENFVFPNKTIGKFLNFNVENVQLEDFLHTTALGVAPKNVTMSILYRAGGGLKHNVGAGQISKIQNLSIKFYSLLLTSSARQFVIDSMVNNITNPEPTQGGAEQETIEQIRVNASFAYASQDRVVTIPDYIARVSSMPNQYGNVYKVMARKNKDTSFENVDILSQKVDQLISQRAQGFQDNSLLNEITQLNTQLKNNTSDVTLFVIARDSNGHLQKPTNTLKRNILTYLKMYTSDRIDVQDLKILNLGCRFSIHVDTNNYNPNEILLQALSLMQDYLSLKNMEPGKSINLDEIRKLLKDPNNIKGIISIPNLDFYIISGMTDSRQYSNDFNGTIDQFYDFNKTIINIPSNCIAEFKHVQSDILSRTSD